MKLKKNDYYFKDRQMNDKRKNEWWSIRKKLTGAILYKECILNVIFDFIFGGQAEGPSWGPFMKNCTVNKAVGKECNPK